MRLFASFISLFLGAVIFATPNLSRRDILFAVPVPPGFRSSATGRRSLAAFRWVVGLVGLAGALGYLWSPERLLPVLSVAVPLLILMAGAFSFIRQHRLLMPHAAQPSPAYREADLTTFPDRVPRFIWAAAGPFAFLAAAALILRDHWAAIPARFPTHWGFDGRPNNWSTRTPRHVYMPLLFGAELCVWLLILGLACWFGSRRSKSRSMILGILVAAEYMLGLLFAVIAIQPLYSLPIWPIVLAPLAFIIPIIFTTVRHSADHAEPIEATPNDCWKGGLIYYNPSDAALFVEKRAGIGYTLNFGNRWSWLLALSLALVIGSVSLI